MGKLIVILLVSLCVLQTTVGDKKPKNKYSAEANEKKTPTTTTRTFDYDPEIRNLQRPFRMSKLNLVWAKAQHRLTEPKLKSLYMELKIHDKEEIEWKQLSSQHKDKEGLKEADLRKKLIGIMSTYDLLDHFDDTQDPTKTKPYKKFHDKSDSHLNKSMFKDKKLNRLWEKAEISGFKVDELKALKEEFQHHQEKLDVYYSLLETVGNIPSEYHKNAVDEENLDGYNEIANADEFENDIERGPGSKHHQFKENINQLRDHHRGIRTNYERLEQKTSKGPGSEDFMEPKVQGLWRVALNSNFTEDELSSLKSELHHYESRLQKLHALHVEHGLNRGKYKNIKSKDNKQNRFEDIEERIDKQTKKIAKLHDLIEDRIFKHVEL